MAREFDVDPRSGLSGGAAAARLEEHGPNRLREAHQRPMWRVILDQFRSVVILMLAGALALALATRQWLEAIALAAVILVNAGIGFASEWNAMKSMETPRRMSEGTLVKDILMPPIRRGRRDQFRHPPRSPRPTRRSPGTTGISSP